jgi:hypothetical protein
MGRGAFVLCWAAMKKLGAMLGVLTLAGCAGPPPPSAAPIEPTLESTRRFERTEGWLAADGAATVDLGHDHVLWLFGDTFVGSIKPDGALAEGSTMVNNTVGVGNRVDESMTFQWGAPDAAGKPTAWAESPARHTAADTSHWLWPTGGGVRLGDDLLVLFFAMLRRRSADDSTIWNFQHHGNATVTVLNPDDPIDQWRTEVAPLRDHEVAIDAGQPSRVINWGPAVLVDPDDASRVLVYGVDATDVARKRLMLARAPRGSLTRFDTWQFRTGDGWSNHEDAATTVAEDVVDEFSVHRHAIDGTALYVLTQSEPMLGARILMRFAPRPGGPWTDAVPVYTCPESATDKRVFVYAAKAHPELRRRDGTLLVTYCANSTDFWQVVGHVGLYRPRVVGFSAEVLARAAREARTNEAAKQQAAPGATR